MGTAHVPRTWALGDELSWEDTADDLFAPLDFVLNPPMCHVIQFTEQAIPDNDSSWTTILWSAADVNDEQMFTTGDQSSVYCKTAGVYRGWFGVSFKATGTSADYFGYRSLRILQNGSTAVSGSRFDTAASCSIGEARVMKGLTFEAELAVNDRISVQACNFYSGTTLYTWCPTTNNTEGCPELFLCWQGRL